jgi:molybdopterin/thiamine biosynthesis adenylyltransferase
MPDNSTLSNNEMVRYERHLIIPDVGKDGQLKLKHGSALIVGLGGLGSAIAIYLAAAGVGCVGIIDDDTINLSNMHRQVLYTESQLGGLKVNYARQRMLDINPLIQVDVYPQRFESSSAVTIAAPYDILVDGSDNLATRYLLNEIAFQMGKPYVYGAIYHFEGQVSVFDARYGPCYRCIFSTQNQPDDRPIGVFGAVPGVIGSLQAAEVLKLLIGIGTPLIGKLLMVDILESRFHMIQLHKNPACPVCAMPG